MLKWFERSLLAFVVIFQLWWFVTPSFNRNKHPFRRFERSMAFMEWIEKRTPESLAAWESEERRLSNYMSIQSTLVFAAFVIVDGIGIYLVVKPWPWTRTPPHCTLEPSDTSPK